MTLSPALKPLVDFAHPLTMWALLALTLYTTYLGFKIRSTRSAEGDAKKELIKQKFNQRHHQQVVRWPSSFSRAWHDGTDCNICQPYPIYAKGK
jgi:hypothetical protein